MRYRNNELLKQHLDEHFQYNSQVFRSQSIRTKEQIFRQNFMSVTQFLGLETTQTKLSDDSKIEFFDIQTDRNCGKFSLDDVVPHSEVRGKYLNCICWGESFQKLKKSGDDEAYYANWRQVEFEDKKWFLVHLKGWYEEIKQISVDIKNQSKNTQSKIIQNQNTQNTQKEELKHSCSSSEDLSTSSGKNNIKSQSSQKTEECSQNSNSKLSDGVPNSRNTVCGKKRKAEVPSWKSNMNPPPPREYEDNSEENIVNENSSSTESHLDTNKLLSQLSEVNP